MEQFFKDFLTEISPALQNLLVVFALAVIAQVSEYLVKLRTAVKAKTSVDQQVFLTILAESAVKTVAQIYHSEANAVKRNRAVSIVNEGLAKAGLKVDLNVVVQAVEAQVFQKNVEVSELPVG